MAKYDDASWHYGGDFPEDLDQTAAATHIGMFLAWCIDNNLLSDFQLEEFAEEVIQVKDRSMKGSQFLLANCDEKFTDEDLNELGNAFARDYYDESSAFAKQYTNYLQDYCTAFEAEEKKQGRTLKSAYHVEDSWENYELVDALLNERFEQWKTLSNQKAL